MLSASERLSDLLAQARQEAGMRRDMFLLGLSRRQGMAYMGRRNTVPKSKLHRDRYRAWQEAEAHAEALERRADFHIVTKGSSSEEKTYYARKHAKGSQAPVWTEP